MPPVVAGTRREYYLPGRGVPHCTIAEGLEPDDICVTVELARSSGACRDVSIQEVGLVQFGPYRVIAVSPSRAHEPPGADLPRGALLYRSGNTPDTAAATAPAHACRPCSERCSWSSLSSRGTSLQTMA